MDIKQIGYFLYMEEQENKRKQLIVNADNNPDLEIEETTTKEEQEAKNFIP